MITKRFILEREPGTISQNVNLEQQVANFIMEWHAEDNLQEVLNMALAANNIPANVIKVGGPPDSIKFYVQPYPNGYKSSGKKLVSVFDSGIVKRR